MDMERQLDSIYRPLALHGLGLVDEANQMFLEKTREIQLWKDDQELLMGLSGIGRNLYCSLSVL